MSDSGLERGARRAGRTADSTMSGAESGTIADQDGPIHPELQRVIEMWPRLTGTVRARILTML